MPTGSGKSTLCTYISDLIKAVRERVGSKEVWEVGDSTFEKMGQLMFLNSGRIFGMYDEVTTFLTQLNVYQGKGLSNSHELALFLQLYNGHSWSRNTGSYIAMHYYLCWYSYVHFEAMCMYMYDVTPKIYTCVHL